MMHRRRLQRSFPRPGKQAALLVSAVSALCLACVSPAARAAESAPGERVVKAFEFNGKSAEGWRSTNHLEPLAVRDGALYTRATGADANMMVSGLDIPCAEVSHVAFRMRSNRSGAVQVYFTTTADPNLAGKPVPTVTYSTPGEWREFRVQLAGVKGFHGRLTGLRLDPVQGAPDAQIAFDWVRLVRLAPRLLIAGFAPDRFPAAPDQPFKMTLRLINVGGPVNLRDVAAELTASVPMAIPEKPPAMVPDAGPGRRWRLTWQVRSPQSGTFSLRARVFLKKRRVAAAQATVPVVGAESLPAPNSADTVFFGEHDEFALTLVSSDARNEPGRAWAILRRRGSAGNWEAIATLAPLAELVTTANGRMRSVALRFPRGVRAGKGLDLRTGENGGVGCRLRLTPTPRGLLRIQTELSTTRPLRIARFSGPVLRVGFGPDGGRKDGALFPGHEFIEGNGPSSNLRVTGPFLYYRPHPAPRTVTVPALAVRRGNLLAGMLWNPLQDWAGTGKPDFTVAEFASPNFLDGQPNHRIACFVPGPPWRSDATLPVAANPFVLKAGGRIRLDARVFVRPGGRLVDAVPFWYRVFGTPAPPAPAHTNRECLDLLIRGYAESLWRPKEKGFTTHLFHGNEKPRWIPAYAADVLVYALRTGETRWAQRIGLGADATLLEVLGTLLDDQSAGQRLPPGLKQQAPDGGWPYHESTRHDVKKYSAGFAERLGEEGKFYNGYTANRAIPVLQHALVWGDPVCRAAGLRALERLRKSRVPVGAQTWEVPAETPDLYGAARIAACFLLGYRLTGNARCLEDARYWLLTGLPFLYAWHVPPEKPLVSALLPKKGDQPGTVYYHDPAHHQVTPWGSLPVFGSSLYRVSWFGTLVHFCGLVWANTVYQYLDLLPGKNDPLLKAAADGVTRVGVNLTLDQAPYIGMLPDGFDVRLNRAQGALIGPMRVEPPLRRLMDRPAFIGTNVRLVRSPRGGALRLLSRGILDHVAWTSKTLRWRQRFLPGQVCEVRVWPLQMHQVRSVRVGNRELPRAAKIGTASEGWGAVHGPDGLGLRVRHAREVETVVVQFR